MTTNSNNKAHQTLKKELTEMFWSYFRQYIVIFLAASLLFFIYAGIREVFVIQLIATLFAFLFIALALLIILVYLHYRQTQRASSKATSDSDSTATTHTTNLSMPVPSGAVLPKGEQTSKAAPSQLEQLLITLKSLESIDTDTLSDAERAKISDAVRRVSHLQAREVTPYQPRPMTLTSLSQYAMRVLGLSH
jgi:hypothetical protein